jgi:HK97 gp10 family phage protein
MAKVIGAKEHSDRMKSLTAPEAVRQVGAALFAAGQEVQVEAQLSITRGAVSGKGHIPSKPGEPPKNDTGVLANNIETTQTGPLTVEVSSNAPYSAALEFGTSKMAERPFMRPAAQAKRARVTELVRGAVAKIIAGGKVVP